jgi:DNA-binding LacI/PurR family transcriptional regulator
MATINDIAKRTGISIGTISKVLTGAPEFSRISAPTVRKIRLAAKTLGYQAKWSNGPVRRQRHPTPTPKPKGAP